MLSLTWSEFGLFMSVAAVLVFTPGANTFYIIANSIDGGKIAGIVTSLGVQLGTLLHVTIAAVGVATLLASSILAFNIIKYLGAAYLIYLGFQTLRTDQASASHMGVDNLGYRQNFYQGFVVQILNPKTTLFVLAFLPQFVDAEAGATLLQFVTLGVILIILGSISDAFYAITTDAVGNYFQKRLSFLGAKRYWIGGVYIGLGLLTALSGISFGAT